MRKFFLFVLPALLCSSVTQANSALWSPAFSAGEFDSTQTSHQLSVIAPEKVCEQSSLKLSASNFDSANTYLWITPAGKIVKGGELNISKTTKSDAGKYTLKVIGVSGDEQIVSTEVKVQSLPSATINGTSSVCEGSVYSLKAVGSSSFSYEWVTPNGASFQTAQLQIEKLKLSDGGVYKLRVVSQGCENSYGFQLNVKAAPIASFEGNTVVCENSKLELRASADSAIKYTWWKGQAIIKQSSSFTIENITANQAGKYLLQAKSNGCISSNFFNVEVKPSFNFSINTSKAELCEGESLFLKANNSGSAVYNWAGPNFSGSQQEEKIEKVSEKNSGKYTLTVTKNGCSLTKAVDVKVSQRPSVKLPSDVSVCENEVLKLSAETNGSYTWVLPNGSIHNGSFYSAEKASKQHEGTYKLVSNAGICSDSSFVNVKVNAVSKPKISGVAEMCEGSNLKLNAESNNGSISWMFANGETLSGSQLNIRATLSQTGTLKVISSANGCSASENITLTVKQAPAVTISGPLDVCRFAPSYSLQAKELNGVKGMGIFSGDIISSAGEINTSKEGTFTIQYSFIGKNGCSVSKTETVKVKKGIEVNAGADLTRKGDEPIQLSAIASDNYTQIEWMNIPASDAKTLRPTVKPEFTTTYKVTVTNAAGCSASDEVTVKVNKLVLANAFSPNGDGINDYFTFEPLRNYPNAQIQIYNSVGKQVFAGKGAEAKWDGTIGGAPCESGTYYYNIKLNDGKQNQPIQGWIQLKR